jgi:hypothetical protein
MIAPPQLLTSAQMRALPAAVRQSVLLGAWLLMSDASTRLGWHSDPPTRWTLLVEPGEEETFEACQKILGSNSAEATCQLLPWSVMSFLLSHPPKRYYAINQKQGVVLHTSPWVLFEGIDLSENENKIPQTVKDLLRLGAYLTGFDIEHGGSWVELPSFNWFLCVPPNVENQCRVYLQEKVDYKVGSFDVRGAYKDSGSGGCIVILNYCTLLTVFDRFAWNQRMCAFDFHLKIQINYLRPKRIEDLLPHYSVRGRLGAFCFPAFHGDGYLRHFNLTEAITAYKNNPEGAEEMRLMLADIHRTLTGYTFDGIIAFLYGLPGHLDKKGRPAGPLSEEMMRILITLELITPEWAEIHRTEIGDLYLSTLFREIEDLKQKLGIKHLVSPSFQGPYPLCWSYSTVEWEVLYSIPWTHRFAIGMYAGAPSLEPSLEQAAMILHQPGRWDADSNLTLTTDGQNLNIVIQNNLPITPDLLTFALPLTLLEVIQEINRIHRYCT